MINKNILYFISICIVIFVGIFIFNIFSPNTAQQNNQEYPIPEPKKPQGASLSISEFSPDGRGMLHVLINLDILRQICDLDTKQNEHTREMIFESTKKLVILNANEEMRDTLRHAYYNNTSRQMEFPTDVQREFELFDKYREKTLDEVKRSVLTVNNELSNCTQEKETYSVYPALEQNPTFISLVIGLITVIASAIFFISKNNVQKETIE